MFVNDAQVEENNCSGYHYKSILQAACSYSKECKETWMEAGLYYEDSSGVPDRHKLSIVKAENEGNFNRHVNIKDSATVYFSAQTHIDFFQCGELIPPETNIKIRFMRNSDSFCLLGPADGLNAVKYKIILKDFAMEFRKVSVLPSLRNYHLTQYANKFPLYLTYPVCDVRAYNITRDIQAKTIKIIDGIKPSQIVIAFVTDASYSGARDQNPFKFQHFNLKKLRLKIAGENYPAQEFENQRLDAAADGKEYTRMYNFSMVNMGIKHFNISNGIKMRDFIENKFIMVYDLTPDLCNGAKSHPIETAQVEVDLNWRVALTGTIQMLVMSIYHNSGIIIQDKKVSKMNDFYAATKI